MCVHARARVCMCAWFPPIRIVIPQHFGFNATLSWKTQGGVWSNFPISCVALHHLHIFDTKFTPLYFIILMRIFSSTAEFNAGYKKTEGGRVKPTIMDSQTLQAALIREENFNTHNGQIRLTRQLENKGHKKRVQIHFMLMYLVFFIPWVLISMSSPVFSSWTCCHYVPAQDDSRLSLRLRHTPTTDGSRCCGLGRVLRILSRN